jgi:plasmid stabilization system protein ParE
MKIRITRSAERDLLAGKAFYEQRAEGIGAYFLDSLFADIDSLILYAGVHAKPDGRFFRALSKRFPFAIYYQMNGDEVTVVAVLDCRRDPASLRNALKKRP